MDKSGHQCARCDDYQCREGIDCLGAADSHRELYEPAEIANLHRAASAIEARHYCRETRLREIVLFAREMKFEHIGLAFCVGLREEARVIEEIFSQDFKVTSVCCKVSGIYKSDYDFEQIDPQAEEVMCNPAGQAQVLNDAGTQLNVLCGLCVGHDAVFGLVSKAPVVTLIVKDRVLAHNPVAAVYCQYVRRSQGGESA